MTFDSLQFVAFYAVMFVAYFTVPERWQKWLLLIGSCYFYMVFVPSYILVLFFLITLDYFLAQAIQNEYGKRRHLYLIISIIANLGTLFFFKYFNFFNQNVALVAHFLHWNYSLEVLRIALPLGLSFHIFQSLAYIFEVYKGRFEPERNYATYALYVMFFPQLVAGPIERPSQLLPQLRESHQFSYDRAVSGLRLMLWGFFKKIVIANWLGVSVDYIYGHLTNADGSVIIVAVFAFAIQLYADFSGYSDIAIGSARVLGIDLVQNFRQPYFSRSIAEFWRRWHISLSSWFRDYVYYPLAWRATDWGAWWLYASIIITFILTGLWHGAGWHFAVMGFLFGALITLGELTKRFRARLWDTVGLAHSALRAVVQTGITFILVSIIWIFFRAPSLTIALSVLKALFTQWSSHSFWYLHCTGFCANYVIGISKTQFVFILCSIGIVVVYELIEAGLISFPHALNKKSVLLPLYYAFILWILLTGYFVPQTFIYFQF